MFILLSNPTYDCAFIDPEAPTIPRMSVNTLKLGFFGSLGGIPAGATEQGLCNPWSAMLPTPAQPRRGVGVAERT